MFSRSKSQDLPVQAPGGPAINPHMLERKSDTRLQMNRESVRSFLLVGVILVQAFALWGLAPLKEVKPYVVRVADNGSVEAVPAGVESYAPNEKTKVYLLGEFVTGMMTVDISLSKYRIKKSFGMTRGKAVQEYTDFINVRDKPMEKLAEDSTRSRIATIVSMSPVEGQDIFLIRFKTEERSVSNPHPVVKRWVITTHYVIIPPKSEEEILANPAGLFVTHFDLREELDQ